MILAGKSLRSDYVLYIISVMLIIAACYALFERAALEGAMGGILMYSAIVFVLFLFGITAFVFGYNMRPQKKSLLSIKPSLTFESLMDLTSVRGIGEKRAKQLKTLGITTVADLSAASAEELSEKLKVSSVIISQWIKNARNLLLEK